MLAEIWLAEGGHVFSKQLGDDFIIIIFRLGILSLFQMS